MRNTCLRTVPACTRSYMGAMGPGLSRTGIKKPDKSAGQVPRIDRSQYKNYLETLDQAAATPDSGIKVSTLPRSVPNAMPSGWVPPPTSLPDLPYFVWRNLDQTLPVEHKENSEFNRYTQISKIEGDIEALRAAVEKFLDDDTIPVVASDITGTVTCLGWRAFEIKRWLQLQGF